MVSLAFIVPHSSVFILSVVIISQACFPSPLGQSRRMASHSSLDNVTSGQVQMRCGPEPDANLEKAIERIRQAAKDGAQIICLPELFRSPYFCQRQDPSLFDLAEPIPGPSTERLGQVARETGTVIIASLFERRATGCYHNTAAVLDSDGRLLGIYR